MRRLNVQLKHHNTQRQLRHAIIRGLERWQQGQDPITDNLPPALRDALLASQTEIGWDQLLLGLPSTKWAIYQQSFYSSQKSRQTGRKWLRGILPQLIRAGRKQWLHRSHYKHHIGKPEEAAMRQLLNGAIINQFQIGDRTLLPGDKSQDGQKPNPTPQQAPPHQTNMVAQHSCNAAMLPL